MSAPKSQENRFTLSFNMGDPIQREAVETLNALGHGKARYIAAAIQHYQNNSAPPVLEQKELQAKVRQILEELLVEHGWESPAIPTTKPKGHAKIIGSDAGGDISEDLDDAILNGLKAFTSG